MFCLMANVGAANAIDLVPRAIVERAAFRRCVIGSKANPPGFAQPGQPGATPYQQAAESQAAQSHVGMHGPVGQSGWTQGPNGQWTQSQQFSGPFQQAFQGLGSQIAG